MPNAKKKNSTIGMQSGNKSQNQTTSSTTAADAESLLRADHRKVEQLFQQYERATGDDQKSRLAQQICLELVIHTKLEEEIFYPACREKNVEDDLLDEAQVEHDGAKFMIAELMEGDPDDEFYDAKVTVLSEYIKHHVGEEEKPKEGIFAKAQEAGVDMKALGQKIQARKQELMAKSEALSSTPPRLRSLDPTLITRSQRSQEDQMARYSNDRDRDEYGRFTSDDDGYSRRGGYRSRSSNDRERDDQGRFMSEDDDYRGRSRGGYSPRGRDYDDDDRRYAGGRGHGGWFGDPEGHSEASERGWEGRSNSRGGYSSRSRDYDDDDDRRYSRGRSHGGWFGDPEGHSEASERGWEGRGSSRGGYSSRSRDYDDDDDRRSSRGRGHGGWFGDPRGHAQAARRGWEDR